MLAIHLLLAGMWEMVWQWGIGVGLLILCLAGAFFSPLFKKDFLYAALIIVVALFFMSLGVAQERSHCTAQNQVIVTTVTKVVKATTTPKAKAAKDKFDDPNN
jgi:hypothetical protein